MLKFNSFIKELTDQDVNIGSNIEIKFTIIKNQEDSTIKYR